PPLLRAHNFAGAPARYLDYPSDPAATIGCQRSASGAGQHSAGVPSGTPSGPGEAHVDAASSRGPRAMPASAPRAVRMHAFRCRGGPGSHSLQVMPERRRLFTLTTVTAAGEGRGSAERVSTEEEGAGVATLFPGWLARLPFVAAAAAVLVPPLSAGARQSLGLTLFGVAGLLLTVAAVWGALGYKGL